MTQTIVYILIGINVLTFWVWAVLVTDKDKVNFFLGEHDADWQEEWTRYKTMI